MKNHLLLIISLSVFMFSCFARADLTIQITEGQDNPTVIAVVPFNYTGTNPLPENVADIISNDLTRTGQFKRVDPNNMLSTPSTPNDVIYRDWRLLASEYLLIGNIQSVGSNYLLTYSLFDVVGQRNIFFNKSIEVGSSGLRDMAHHVSDKVYEQITGIRGAFSTSIVYVEHQKSANTYRLIKADMDGARPQELLRSKEPLLSPAWSPDGNSVAYVSFESRRPAIYRQNVFTGKRERLTKFKGLNSAPSWSPDGRKLAMVLSKDGNPEVYTLDLASRKFTRVTNHFAIDTEPTWTADSRNIIFTSSRGGKPQIYQVAATGGRAERLTFRGDYNAQAQLTPDGKSIIMVHRSGGVFHIATQNLRSGDVRVLTKTSLDESPSMAPNGASLIYATKVRGKGILASVSLDGGAKFNLPSRNSDVREPSWSPYFK